eukprot:COSAG01_NODE_104_length_26171_cov_96.617612_12_plen_149_part_00
MVSLVLPTCILSICLPVSCLPVRLPVCLFAYSPCSDDSGRLSMTPPTMHRGAASKAALDQLTRVMAVELARSSIRVNGLAPGYFATEMNGEFFETSQGRQYIQRRFVTKRLGQLHELDGALLLLASEAGSYITGQTLAIDGGHLQSAL